MDGQATIAKGAAYAVLKPSMMFACVTFPKVLHRSHGVTPAQERALRQSVGNLLWLVSCMVP